LKGASSGKDYAISILKDTFPTEFLGIRIIPTIYTEIKSIIYSLKSKSSSGYDEITKF
jgi:hypothetical protein